MKQIMAIISFFFSFIGLAVVVGLLMILVFRPEDPSQRGVLARFVHISAGLVWRTAHGNFCAGVGTEWWNLPGTILGIFGGYYSAKAALRGKKKSRKLDSASSAE